MINRRQLTKRLAAAVALTGSASLNAQNDSLSSPESATLQWTPIHPGIWKATLGTPESYTPIRSRLIPENTQALHTLSAVAQPPLPPPQGSVIDRGSVLRLPLQPEEMVFGFGLQLLSFNQRGKKKTIRVNADPRVDSGDTHAPVPFYVTTSGYGVLVDTARHVEFYCGDARPKPTRPQSLASNAVNTPDSTRNLSPQAPGEVTIEVPRTKGVDIYLFAGPTMIEAVQRYNLFSGGGLVPPEWGLGFWYRAYGQAHQDAVLNLAREFRDHKIPCDVIGLEPGWQTHAYSCSFVWDNARYPNPNELVQKLSSEDYKVNLWEHAFTHPSSPIFEPLLSHSGNYGVWGGLVPDFAGEPACNIFGDYHGRALIDMGISGFKLDECDNSDFTGGWSFPDLSRFPSGIDGEQMHAVFGLRYQQAILQQFQRRNRPTYNLVRSSGALAAPYPFVLYSDLYDHRQFIRALVNSGFSGLLWCPEVRDASSEEDLIRRLQSVIFSPLAMVNAWYIQSPPWKQINQKKNNAGEFAENWQALEARCREIIGWRMQLVPYLLSAFERYAATGIPPFRALILDHPTDKNLLAVDDEYMVGDRMLVAPLFAGEPERRITLPEGDWHDFWTGKPVQGGTTFSVSGTTEKIPVFVRAGSVVPWANIAPSTADPENRKLTVRVYGNGSLPWTLNGREHQVELTSDASTKSGRVKQTGSAKLAYTIQKWEQYT